MSDTVTTDVLRARVRADTGFEGDAYALDADLTDLCLRSARALHDELIGGGQEYYRSVVTLTTVVNQAAYNLPGDFYRLLQVSVQTRSGLFERARPYEHYEVADALNQGTFGRSDDFGYYRLGGSYGGGSGIPTETIEWLPAPKFARQFRVDYIPTPVFDLRNGEYAIRSHGPGWEEFIVADVAAKLLEREEGDPSPWLRRKGEALERIKRLAPTRDAGAPTRITRTADYYGVMRPVRPWDRYGRRW